MNRKILFIVNHDLVIYNFRKELVQKLIEEDYQVYISSPNGKRIPELIDMGCKFVETSVKRHGKNPINDMKLLSDYKKIISEIKPLCILTYTIKPNIFGAIAARSYGIPCFSNITGLGMAVEKVGILQHITTLLYKYAFKNVNTVFFQNEENLNFFIDKKISEPQNYHLLPGSGVNLEDFKYVDYPKKNDIIKFAFISRIMKEKGIDLYLEAAKVIKEKYPNTEFHICGFCEEDYFNVLEDYAENGYIVYHGMVDNIKEFLSEMHCTIHPSYYPEGLSNVLLESSAIGRPIITTDRSGCREVVGNNNGYLIKKNNTQELINMVEKFILLNKSDKKNMGLNGREFVEKYYDRNIVVDKYLEKINDLGGDYNIRKR